MPPALPLTLKRCQRNKTHDLKTNKMMKTRPQREDHKRLQKAERQRAYRESQKTRRRPSRNDVAANLLYLMIQHTQKNGNWYGFDAVMTKVVRRLSQQGFDEAASKSVVESLVDRCANGRFFKRQPNQKNERSEA